MPKLFKRTRKSRHSKKKYGKKRNQRTRKYRLKRGGVGPNDLNDYENYPQDYTSRSEETTPEETTPEKTPTVLEIPDGTDVL